MIIDNSFSGTLYLPPPSPSITKSLRIVILQSSVTVKTVSIETPTIGNGQREAREESERGRLQSSYVTP